MTAEKPEGDVAQCQECGWANSQCVCLPVGPVVADSVTRALAELVACKDLKEAAMKLNPMARGAPGKVRADMLAEYKRRKRRAWDAGRSALGQGEAK